MQQGVERGDLERLKRRPLARAGADQRAACGLPDGGVAHRHRLRQRGGAVGGDAADQIAVIAVEQVQITLAVDDTDMLADD